jgi:hypothetical protein
VLGETAQSSATCPVESHCWSVEAMVDYLLYWFADPPYPQNDEYRFITRIVNQIHYINAINQRYLLTHLLVFLIFLQRLNER